jgi:hypothetical protein
MPQKTMEETTMKITIAISLLTGLLGLSSAVLAADPIDVGALERQKAVFQERRAQLAEAPIPVHLLEPCMNGGVSASGLYPSQAAEDRALAGAMHASRDATRGPQQADAR